MRSRFFTGLWAHPDFVRLWAATTTSTFGSLIGQLALSFTAIIFLDASAAEVAVLGGCQLVPGFIASPFAGVWVDRLRRRPVMIAADLGRTRTDPFDDEIEHHADAHRGPYGSCCDTSAL